MNFRNFIEYQQFGFNNITLAFFGTIVFGLILCWGLWKQKRAIESTNSSKSVAVLACAYFIAHYFAFSVYGYRQHCLAMILNGLIGFLFLVIYVTAVRTPDYGKWKKWHLVFLLLIPLMALVPNLNISLSQC